MINMPDFRFYGALFNADVVRYIHGVANNRQYCQMFTKW